MEASLEIEVNEKQDIFKVFLKFSLLVSIYLPFNSSLSEKAIACRTKSRLFHLFFIFLKVLTILSSFSTLHSKISEEFISLKNYQTFCSDLE